MHSSKKTAPLTDHLSEVRALRVLEDLYLTRYADEKLSKLVRQNQGGSFYLSGAGHELVGAVSAQALIPGKDWALPYYRDQAFPISLGCCLKDIFACFLGRDNIHHGGGRVMSYHYSHRPLRLLAQSSPVGSQFLQAAGLAYSAKLAKTNEVVYVSSGEGGTSQGDFHEALNFASLHSLPIIFVIQDNGWAISVPISEQIAAGSIIPLASSYPRVYAKEVDGTDYLELASHMAIAVQRARQGDGPSVISAKVPRIGGHSNSDDPQKYQTPSEQENVLQQDPLPKYEQFLLQEKLSSKEEIEHIRQVIKQRIEDIADEAVKMPYPKKGNASRYILMPTTLPIDKEEETSLGEDIVIMDGINHAIREEMEADSSIVTFGQDVAKGKGGVFGVTRGLTDQFGTMRCFNTPLAESTIMGLALGISSSGRAKAIAEIQFADYIWTGMNQLINEIATLSWRSNGQWTCPCVIRLPYGGYIQGGNYHSQSLEGYLTHCPGLKILVPSNASDAKMLMKAAIRDPNPVIFLEHKAIYRQKSYCSRKEPSKEAVARIGVAKCVRKGEDITLVSWGFLLTKAYQIAERLEKEEEISVEVIDLSSLIPLDMQTILTSVEKTGKVVILSEEAITSGFSAEIASQIMEKGFNFLDAPVKRISGLDVPVGYSKPIEDEVLPQVADIYQALIDLYNY